MITLSHVEHSYGLEPVLTDFSMVVHAGERVGLIGANGSGKSTIFKLIVGLEKPTQGTVAVGRSVRIGYLTQIPERPAGQTVEMRLWQSVSHLLQIEQQMRELEERMAHATSEEMDDAMRIYGQLSVDFEHQGGYSFESRMRQVIQGLGLTVPMDRYVAELSGGELARLELAVLLLQEPEVLLLDEPTNHLDFSAVTWLEDFLNQYKGTVLIVSHDRYFLDRTVRRVVEVKNGTGEEYPGNYSYYIVERERRYELALQAFEVQQKEIKRKEEAIKRLRIWAAMADNKKMFRQAASMQKQLDRMDKLERPTEMIAQFQLQFEGERSGKEVMVLKGVSKSFGERQLLQPFDWTLFYGQRIGLLGPNGAGKTTLIKLMMQQLEPDTGTVKPGANLQIGYFDQQQECLNREATMLESFLEDAPMPVGKARNILGYFGYTGDDVFKLVKEMSGGERSRLMLLKIVFTQVNFLILDEPTNHFDLPSVEVLEEALQNFRGTLLVISHDRYFLNQVVDGIYALEEGELVYYPGNYDTYRQRQDERAERKKLLAKEVIKPKEVDQRKTTPTGNGVQGSIHTMNTRSEKEERKRTEQRLRTLSNLEAEIASLEIEIAERYQRMTEPKYLEDFAQLHTLQQENEKAEARLNELLSRWEELASDS